MLFGFRAAEASDMCFALPNGRHSGPKRIFKRPSAAARQTSKIAQTRVGDANVFADHCALHRFDGPALASMCLATDSAYAPGGNWHDVALQPHAVGFWFSKGSFLT